jgi:DNA-binding response OmpR family regulator
MSITKIVIVDDEVNLTKMLKLNLEENGNYEVRTVNQAKHAIDSIREFMPDLVLLDIMMPELQGNEIAEIIMDDSQLREIKIIFLTALITKTEAPEAGKKIAGRKFLAKPVKIAELLACIEEELEKENN